jgi:hypothetical protein
MADFIICVICFVLLVLMFVGRRRRAYARDDEGRFISGAEYDPTHYQVLRENVLRDG